MVPTYNEEENIGDLLVNLSLLDHQDMEIIVVDDGSTDNTRKIVEGFEDIVKVFKEHKGRAQTINEGIKRATGQFVWQLNADVVIRDEEIIQKLLEPFSKDEKIVAVWGAIGVENDEKFFPAMMKASKEINPSYLYGGANVMFRSDFIKSNLYVEDGEFSGEDYEMREKIPEKGLKSEFTDRATIDACYPEGFLENLKQRFRYARSHVRLMKKRFKARKLIPIFRDWVVAGGLIFLPFINHLLWFVLFALTMTYFFQRSYKTKEVYKNEIFAVLSIFAELFFVFVRSIGYFREMMS